MDDVETSGMCSGADGVGDDRIRAGGIGPGLASAGLGSGVIAAGVSDVIPADGE